MHKKQWQTPELIILSRGRPEEAVLASCKASQSSGGQPGNGFSGCDRATGPSGSGQRAMGVPACTNCQTPGFTPS